MWSSCIVLAALACLAREDIRKKELSVLVLAALGLLGLGRFFLVRPFSAVSLIGGIALGGMLLAGSFMTKGAVGKGDGILLCASGCWLGFSQNLTLLFLASLLASAAALFLLISGKKNRTGCIPFVPFLLGAYLLLLAAG